MRPIPAGAPPGTGQQSSRLLENARFANASHIGHHSGDRPSGAVLRRHGSRRLEVALYEPGGINRFPPPG